VLDVGRIGRAHGVRGAVHVSLSTDRAERVEPGARLFDGDRWLTVITSRRVPGGSSRFDTWIVQFEGIADRDAAEAMAGRSLSAEPIDDPDALWIHDLIGASVVDTEGVVRGTCVAVIDNPAHDLLELDSGHLVPVVFVTAFEGGVITIDPPDGLFDLLDDATS
jgi:16S rRNA processing protein RimM